MAEPKAESFAEKNMADEHHEAEPAIAWNARDYAPLPGVPDEMVDAAGNVRPVWQPFVNALSGMTASELSERFARADRYLRDAGVFYRAYDGQDDTRAWPFSHIPIIIDDNEWQELADGLKQRADLLEAMMADFYSDNRLVSEGFIPPPSSPPTASSCGRSSASIRPAAITCISYRLKSGAARTANGGCWPIARRPPPAPVLRWKTALPHHAPFPVFTATCMCVAWQPFRRVP
nr:circularly permuted type 2 ATP-grasp protein [Marinicella sp. W31]MDC2876351.1 circularly permuted type 2 ATP-grasp protein [Marinicella sp. W31]